MATADLILHPVRLRIVRAFLGGRLLTTSALAAELADVPPASLYRHVARLVDAGVLEVVAERRVRGALERTYVLHVAAANIGADELAVMSADEHRQMFITFVAGLVGDFDSYLADDDIDLIRDKVRYRLADLWLTDAELPVFLDGVRDPADRPGHGEDRLCGTGDHAGHAGQGGQREVDVRLGQGAAAGFGQYGVGDRIPAGPGRRLLHQVEQGLRPRVGTVCDVFERDAFGRGVFGRGVFGREVAEPGYPLPRRSRSPTSRTASAGSRAAASMTSAPSEAPP